MYYSVRRKLKTVISQLILAALFFLLGVNFPKKEIVKRSKPKTKIIVNNVTYGEFHKDSLIRLLKNLNVKFPHIVMAQSILETGHWTSKIYNENNNLFGMKEASVRVHNSKGTKYGHAYYDNWVESVYDYCFYQTTYLSGIKDEGKYYGYLGRNYAQSPLYVVKLKQIVDREKLKELFK